MWAIGEAGQDAPVEPMTGVKEEPRFQEGRNDVRSVYRAVLPKRGKTVLKPSVLAFGGGTVLPSAKAFQAPRTGQAG